MFLCAWRRHDSYRVMTIQLTMRSDKVNFDELTFCASRDRQASARKHYLNYYAHSSARTKLLGPYYASQILREQ